jgi:flagellar biosynthetic protein FliP
MAASGLTSLLWFIAILVMIPAALWLLKRTPAGARFSGAAGGATGLRSIAVLPLSASQRIVIVLSLLRQALGTQAAPPNQVVIGLSLFLTFFVMGPTLDKVYADAYQPYSESKIAFDEALKRGEVPVREFMMKQTRQADVMLFARLAKLDPAVKTADVPFKVLVPAFVTSELKSAFQIGFLIFIPFLIIDMIVASVLMSLGMMMLSPVLIALPFKLMLFVLADGWNLLLGSLAASFAT